MNRVALALGAHPIRTAKLHDGSSFLVDLRAHTEWHAFFSGRYDDLWVDLCVAGLRPGEIFLDVGANIGIFTVRVARNSKVVERSIAFEPFPPNVARLRENLALNAVSERVNVHHYGLSDADTTANLTLRLDFQQGSATGNAAISISPEADQDFETVEIPLRRLDAIAADLPQHPVGVIKIDIEGHEDQFFVGGQETLARHRPLIVTEICKDYCDWKGVTLEQAYRQKIPENYLMFRENMTGRTRARDHLEAGALVAFDDFDTLPALVNILLCPAEKTDRIAAFL
ncbi:MAG: FkbM family methyltransferase [Sphingopyxis sp.]